MKNDRLVAIVALLGFVAIGFYLYHHTGTGRTYPGLVGPGQPPPGMQQVQVIEVGTSTPPDERRPSIQQAMPTPATAASPTPLPGSGNGEAGRMPGGAARPADR